MRRDGRMVVTAEAKAFKRQHNAPCSDCPWARKSVPGWIGPNSINAWIRAAHGDGFIACHTRKLAPEVPVTRASRACSGQWQCAGGAIYRANVVKRPRDPDIMKLPENPVLVFTFHEFERHHGPALEAMGIGPDESLEG